MEVRGWSEAERAHAARILASAEAAKHPHVKLIEHFHFILLLLVTFLGNMCFAVVSIPLLFLNILLAMALMFLFGALMGLMFVHALRSLKVQRTHHLIGFVVLILSSLVAKTYVIQQLQARFLIVGVHQESAFYLSIPFIIGLLIPYATERQLHGSA